MRKWLLLVGILVATSAPLSAAAPSYARDVAPIFKRYCIECHNANDGEGELNLESYKAILKGGDRGAAFVAGKPDASLLIRMIEGKIKPVMPPRKAKQPTAAEIALVRAWVAAGAKEDSASPLVRLPAIVPKNRIATPISAVACTPDSKTVAVSGRGEVLILDPATGEVRSRLPAGRDRVTAIVFDSKGTRLAVAASTSGAGHEVRLWQPTAGGLWQGTGTVAMTHDDVIHDLTFSADGKLLASASYDRLVKIWDVPINKERHTLKDHSDSVYGVSFSPDGKLLASGGADRAVKVWDVVTGNRLYTLGEANDWVYAVAWSPLGKHLAAAGVDRSIRVWEADARGGKIIRSAFGHEKAVTRLVYSADGKSLYSLGEDRLAKSWDANTLTERLLYPRQPETVLSLAVRSTPGEVLLGRYDGVLLAVEIAKGTATRQILPPMRPPVLEKIAPTELRRGKNATLNFTGRTLDGSNLVSDLPGLSGTVSGGKASLTIPATAKPGRYSLRLKNEAGQSAPQMFFVDRFAVIAEVEPNDSAQSSQAISLPATVTGTISRAGDIDWFRFEAKAGDEIGVEALTTEIASKLSPVLTLVDALGNTLVESVTGHLGHRCDKAGVLALGIRDREYRGGADLTYRLSVGPIPVVTSYFPLGVRQGTSADIRVEGVNLGKSSSARIEVPKNAVPGSRMALSLMTPEGAPLGIPSLVVGEFAEVSDIGKERTIAVPATANGRISTANSAQRWQFAAKKGQRLILEVEASRIGSPLDSTIEILDAAGRPLPRAVLRSHARTYVAFRDHESRTTGIRLETWSELAVNDFMLLGSELLRIRALPRNPDDNCEFFSEQGQRLGFLGTTPIHESLGTPMYKVTIHPPGSTFPANGLPLVTLFWRNDDGGPRFGKDSRLVFDPPADATYQVRVRDARGEGSPAHGYRLTIRPPRPDFQVSLAVAGTVSKGGAVPVRVNVTRLDEFDGMIDVKLVGLPTGYTAPETNILGSDDATVCALSADVKTLAPPKPTTIRLEARATIGGKVVLHEASAPLPQLIDPGDIVTTTAESEVTIKPGSEVKLTVRVDRRNGFTGRIPVEVQGLPFGVRVLDVGLNGILITQVESRRTIVLSCEPWVQAMEHPIVVTARHERKGSEHAARSLLLRVGK